MPKSVYSVEGAILAKAMTDARKESGLHQAELAARLGKDQTIISNVERGQRRVDMIEFYEFAKAIRRDPVELYRKVVLLWENSKKES